MTAEERAEVVAAVLEALAPTLRETNERLRALDTGVGTLLELSEDHSARLMRHTSSLGRLKKSWEHCSEQIVGLHTVVHSYQAAVEETVDKTGARMHARVEKLERFLPGIFEENEDVEAGAAGE